MRLLTSVTFSNVRSYVRFLSLGQSLRDEHLIFADHRIIGSASLIQATHILTSGILLND